MFQAIITLFGDLKPLAVEFFPSDTVETLRLKISKILKNTPFALTKSSKPLNDKTILSTLTTDSLLFLSVSVPLLGGKGGFGSMLRAQGGRMNAKKTTNFESCRDLSGRRLKTINEAKNLANFLEKEPERKRKRDEALKEKVEKGLSHTGKKTVLFDDPEFDEEYEKTMEEMDDVLEKALLAKKQKKSLQQDSKKGKEKMVVIEKQKKKVAVIWGEDDLSSSSEEEDDDK